VMRSHSFITWYITNGERSASGTIACTARGSWKQALHRQSGVQRHSTHAGSVASSSSSSLGAFASFTGASAPAFRSFALRFPILLPGESTTRSWPKDTLEAWASPKLPGEPLPSYRSLCLWRFMQSFQRNHSRRAAVTADGSAVFAERAANDRGCCCCRGNLGCKARGAAGA
jgi:hypothetical protein